MTVFVVVMGGTDPEIELHRDRDAALARARAWADGYTVHGCRPVKEPVPGWLINIRCTQGDDSVHVEEKELLE